MKMIYRKKLIPDGVYDARISDVREIETRKGPSIRIAAVIESDNPNYDGLEVSTLARPVLAGKSRLARYYEEVMGVALKDGMEICLEDLVGKAVSLRIENRENGQNVFPRSEEMKRRE